jgi:rod shape-determining protein MreC
MEFSSPPPLFKQGASARAKVLFFALMAIALLVVDARMQSLAMLRQLLGTALYPLQAAALMPRDVLYRVGDYFASQTRLEQENQAFQRQHADSARALQHAQFLEVENRQLRQLLAIREQLAVKSVASEILYDTRDPFTRKIVLDRGSRDGVAAGQPVIDATGIVGQVTRIFPFTAEVSLLTDNNQAIPVQVLRNGLRSVAYGRGQSGLLELRFVVANADIQNGDVLVTSGIDSVYPPGLAVARVTQVENKVANAFAHIVCEPLAGLGRHRQLLVLLTEAKPLPRAEAEAETEQKEITNERPGSRATREKIKPAAGAKPGPKKAGSAPKKAAPAQGVPR